VPERLNVHLNDSYVFPGLRRAAFGDVPYDGAVEGYKATNPWCSFNIDHQALVQDRVDNISEAAGRGAVKVSVGRVGCDGHEINSRERVDGSLASQAASSRF
jgi:hypothetical protein